ncbi:MAG: hypothetical protein AAFU79_01280 [Myxococcota bacterium]
MISAIFRLGDNTTRARALALELISARAVRLPGRLDPDGESGTYLLAEIEWALREFAKSEAARGLLMGNLVPGLRRARVRTQSYLEMTRAETDTARMLPAEAEIPLEEREQQEQTARDRSRIGAVVARELGERLAKRAKKEALERGETEWAMPNVPRELITAEVNRRMKEKLK